MFQLKMTHLFIFMGVTLCFMFGCTIPVITPSSPSLDQEAIPAPLTPMPAESAPLSGGRITVTLPSNSVLQIDKVELGKRIPADCDPAKPLACIYQAEEGFRTLAIWLSATAAVEPQKIMREIFALPTDAVYVTMDNGIQQRKSGGGLVGGSSYIVVFGVPETEQEFTLHWLEQAPIELGKIILTD
ncbi:MAG: hypothetical protein R3E79_06855 [Caldilineaceae bacterium]